ncbi:hypothetical protein EEQ99_32265 [Rhizobium anhuiense]|uniref:Uncharacterized protein n=1 Tax=Rhizobium anhuiense TaxID=1184720 RepID=A0A3S0PXJ2_9HYPH|nr:hypothetical protein EEQ99_32265 [Rhizobium anhuiense]
METDSRWSDTRHHWQQKISALNNPQALEGARGLFYAVGQFWLQEWPVLAVFGQDQLGFLI